MTFEEEVNALLDGIEIDAWGYYPNADGYDANLYFAWTSDEDQPPGQPISFEDLQCLDDEYGIYEVYSASSGRTGSCLTVRLEEL